MSIFAPSLCTPDCTQSVPFAVHSTLVAKSAEGAGPHLPRHSPPGSLKWIGQRPNAAEFPLDLAGIFHLLHASVKWPSYNVTPTLKVTRDSTSEQMFSARRSLGRAGAGEKERERKSERRREDEWFSQQGSEVDGVRRGRRVEHCVSHSTRTSRWTGGLLNTSF